MMKSTNVYNGDNVIATVAVNFTCCMHRIKTSNVSFGKARPEMFT